MNLDPYCIIPYARWIPHGLKIKIQKGNLYSPIDFFLSFRGGLCLSYIKPKAETKKIILAYQTPLKFKVLKSEKKWLKEIKF